MDPVKIIKRAWHILWSYRTLWVFGLIITLTAAGSPGGSGNNGTRFSANDRKTFQAENLPEAIQQFNNEMDRIFDQGSQQLDFAHGELNTILWVAGIFGLIMLVVAIVMTIGRYVSETAVIRMVDEYENSDSKMSVRDGFHIGWSRTSWRLFLINLVVNLPAILLFVVLASVGFGVYFAVENGSLSFTPFSVITMIGVVFLLIFVVGIVSIGLNLLRQFVWRVSALEDIGVQDAFSRGWNLVRENWKDVGLMWLVMIGLGIAWTVVSIIAVIVTIPIVIITLIIGLAIVVIPVLLLVGLFSLFLSTPLAWAFGILFMLPLFFVIGFSPWVLLGSWKSVFTSTVWTLTYREIKAMPATVMAEEPADS